MNSIETNICNAIEIIVNKAIAEANYDKTIQATIVSCVDQTIGKYTVKYQDSTFYAYSTNSGTTYTAGSLVYVLIPGNDTEADKTILGTTKKLGINYINTIEEDEAYSVIGNNCIENSSDSFNLQSYKKDKQVKVLYSKDYKVGENLITLNQTSINEYIKNQNSIICGAIVRTALPTEQQLRGNYGLLFALNFNDNATGEVVTRYYTVDVDKMRGNPYKILYDTRQYGIFDIDGENFIEVDSISIFCYNFPNSKEDSQCVDDIFIKNIELCGAEKLSNDDLDNYALTFYTPNGIYFDKVTSNIKLEAQVRVKGKVIDNNSQNLPFYWFMEDASVNSESTYYNKYGGQGWKCLNDYTLVKKATETDHEVVEWIPATYLWTLNKEDVLAKEIKYKCVAIYDGTVISRTIVIKNLLSIYDITIESSEGTQFYFDIGYPTLKCLVNGKEDNNYSYSWAVTNNADNFENIPETSDITKEYEEVYNNYYTLLNNIQRELLPLEPNRARLNYYKEELDKYDKITRVEGNTIYHLNISGITNFSTYRCTVYYGTICLGTQSIVISNSLTAEGAYSLVINDGSCVFKYDENGVSPASSAKDTPINIKALTFNVYDNLGNQIDDEVIKRSNIQWIVPITNTLIEIPNYYSDYEEDLTKGIRIYKGFMSFAYEIADRYDITKTNNYIQVMIDYNGMILSSKTNFTFTKEGDEGTNGTEFYCKIVPNVIPGLDFPTNPTLTEYSRYNWSLNYTPQQANKFFRVQLWHNETKVLDSITSAKSAEGKNATIKWSILKNKYTALISDDSAISVNESTGVFTYNGYKSNSPANIIKVEVKYDNVVYYATLPLITAKVYNDTYNIYLKDNTGFKTAVYSSDGQSPRYDNTSPFELKVTQKIDGYEEDISQKTTEAYSVKYSWKYLGRVYDNQWIDSINIGDRLVSELKANQKAIKPLDSYDGQCVTNALEGIVTKSEVEIACIHIPIQLMLNRYGNSAINGWDGNSVNIDSDGGFILAPQVGAGIKETDNSFTGVVMGKVKESNQSVADIGLIGYAKGVRSIFLDSNTGKAVFGANGKGQITIDPTQNTARLYSGNFKYSPDGIGTGMEIDLTTPQIRFGSGNFEVNKEGHITAKGGGSVAGWQITDNELYSPSPYGSRKLTLDSAHIKIYSGTKDNSVKTDDGFYLDPSNLVLGSKFKASADGKLEIGTGAAAGNGSKRWTLDGDQNNSYIKYGDKGNTGSVYIGTNDMQLGKGFSVTAAGLMKVGNLGGKYWTISSKLDSSQPAFISYNHTVDTNTAGEVTNGPSIGSVHASKSMYIGTDGIAIGDKFLIAADNSDVKIMYNTSGLNDYKNNSFYLSTDGVRIGNRFKVSTDNSSLLVGRLDGAHWEINGNSSRAYIAYGGTTWSEADSDSSDNSKIYLGTDGISLGRRFSVSKQGVLKSYSGVIGGWNISRNKLSAGNMEINSAGSIKGGSSYGWSIDTAGTAIFNRIKADNSGTIGGWTINGAMLTGGGTTLNSNGTITCSTLYASTAGTIGGWTISSSGLSGGGITLASGTITGTGFKLNSNGLAFSKGTISLGGSGKGSNGISYTGGKCTVSGDIYANNGYFSGEIAASSFTFGSGDNSFSMGHGTSYPSAGGLNVGSAGIRCQGGITCTNIGHPDKNKTVELRCSASVSGIFTVAGSAYMYVGDRTLSEYVNDTVKANLKDFATKGTYYGETEDGLSCWVEVD